MHKRRGSRMVTEQSTNEKKSECRTLVFCICHTNEQKKAHPYVCISTGPVTTTETWQHMKIGIKCNSEIVYEKAYV